MVAPELCHATSCRMVEPQKKTLNPSLLASIERNRNVAWEQAHFRVAQRDEMATKIAGALTGLNGASLIALLGVSSGNGTAAAALGLTGNVAFNAFCAFVLGVVGGGAALMAHHHRAVHQAGAATARAITLDTILLLAQSEPSEENFARINEQMAIANTHMGEESNFSLLAIGTTWLSIGAWMFAVITPIPAKLFPSYVVGAPPKLNANDHHPLRIDETAHPQRSARTVSE